MHPWLVTPTAPPFKLTPLDTWLPAYSFTHKNPSFFLSVSIIPSLSSPSHEYAYSSEMPSPLRNGDVVPHRTPSPAAAAIGNHHHHFISTVSEQKLRRLNALILLFRFAAFCFTLAAAIFMAANSPRSSGSPSWLDFDTFRLVLAANGIVALYSLFEMGASIWEILRGATMLPETLQLWFDFSHDQVFAYLLLAAEAAGTGEARGLRRGTACVEDTGFCTQADISVALGFVGFAFLGLSALISGYRVACFTIIGARFHF